VFGRRRRPCLTLPTVIWDFIVQRTGQRETGLCPRFCSFAMNLEAPSAVRGISLTESMIHNPISANDVTRHGGFSWNSEHAMEGA